MKKSSKWISAVEVRTKKVSLRSINSFSIFVSFILLANSSSAIETTKKNVSFVKNENLEKKQEELKTKSLHRKNDQKALNSHAEAFIPYDYKVGEITKICSQAIDQANQKINQLFDNKFVANEQNAKGLSLGQSSENNSKSLQGSKSNEKHELKTEQMSGNTSLLQFENLMSDLNDVLSPVIFMAYVSTNDKLNQEASKCETKYGQFGVEVFTRKDLYELFKKGENLKDNQINPLVRRLQTLTFEEFEKNGIQLKESDLAQVRKWKSELTEIETQFSNNLNKDESSIEVFPQELEGVPSDYIASLKKVESGRVQVRATEADYPMVIQNARQSETRKKMFQAYLNRGGEANEKLLSKALALRLNIAEKMGFKSWTDYKMQRRMARNRQEIMEFLNGLKEKLKKSLEVDYQDLKAFQKELSTQSVQKNETGNANKDHQISKSDRSIQEKNNFSNEFEQWDVSYLNYQMKKMKYDVDQEKIREYFPAKTVIKGLFEVYSQLLGVEFKEIKDAKVWAPQVQLFSVKDKMSGQIISYFYTDFYPRKGKYDHAAAFPIISGREILDSQNKSIFNKPVSAIVANLTPGMNGKPPLLDHSDVETLFHEFGHIMHQVLTRVPFSSLSGSSVAQDFVEAPSQMLENWVWSEAILEKISGHYLRPTEKLPKKLLDQMIKARDFHQSMLYTRQLLYAIFDMNLHSTREAVEPWLERPNQLYLKLYQEVTGQKPSPGQNFPSSFGHLMGGYDSGYYGYLWSEVYAMDMFTLFSKNNLMNPEIGLRYRKLILESGNSEEPRKLLENFLGRSPSNEAFFEKLNIH